MTERQPFELRGDSRVRLVRATPVLVRGGGAVLARDVLSGDVALRGEGLELLARLGVDEPIDLGPVMEELAAGDAARRAGLEALLADLAARRLLTGSPAPLEARRAPAALAA